jgi:hypothetical protein
MTLCHLSFAVDALAEGKLGSMNCLIESQTRQERGWMSRLDNEGKDDFVIF